MCETCKRDKNFLSDKLQFVSTGLCPNCNECKDNYDYDSISEYNQDLENGDLEESPSFSYYPCDDCNTILGGNSYAAHGKDDNGNLIHFTMCHDCFMEFHDYVFVCEIKEYRELSIARLLYGYEG